MIFDGIVLDIDGTIWNTTEIVAAAWNEAIQETNLKIKISADILRSEFGKTMEEIADDLFSSVKLTERKKLMEECCKKEQNAIRTNTKKIEYDHVVETIQSMAKTRRLFIVSNCQKGYIELVMEKMGITSYISDYECFGNTGNRKSLNIIDIVKRNSIAHPVYVGDTQGDCDACKEATVPFIWASYGFGNVNSYYAVIKSFIELEKIV
jgi:phosphoglycolate phosphatase